MAKGDLIITEVGYQEDGSIEVRVWLWGSDHNRVAWDGVSQLGINMDDAIEVALRIAKSMDGGTYRINSVSLEQTTDPYLSIHVESSDDAADGLHTILLDVKGQVIKPTTHCFKSDKAYEKFHDKLYAEHGSEIGN